MAQYTLHRYSVDIKSMSSTVTSLHFIDNRGGSGVVAVTNKLKEPSHGVLYIYVVVNFLFQLIFVFPLFWDMVMYANEFKTKEKQKLTEIKN